MKPVAAIFRHKYAAPIFKSSMNGQPFKTWWLRFNSRYKLAQTQEPPGLRGLTQLLLRMPHGKLLLLRAKQITLLRPVLQTRNRHITRNYL